MDGDANVQSGPALPLLEDADAELTGPQDKGAPELAATGEADPCAEPCAEACTAAREADSPAAAQRGGDGASTSASSPEAARSASPTAGGSDFAAPGRIDADPELDQPPVQPEPAATARPLAQPLLQPQGLLQADGDAEGTATNGQVEQAVDLEEGTSARAPRFASDFNYEPPETRPLPPFVEAIQQHAFRIFLVTTFVGTALILAITYERGDSSLFGIIQCSEGWKLKFKYFSIPLVSICFTWWHVWLGIQMCFYPVQFKGCCFPYLGWQGIVPRRAEIMASRSCDLMIGHLITVEEIIDRIHPEDFFSTLEPVLAQTSAAVVGRLARQHCPDIWQLLPQWCKDELQTKVLEESRKMFNPVIADLKGNINQIVDIKQMAIDVLIDNKPLLVKMFLQIGQQEFVFIQHMSAVMGFILGLVQMCLWMAVNSGEVDGRCEGFQCWGGYLILPVSGLIIGYFTNWLGITMIFRPVRPRIICGGYVNIQGVFLKRQKQVSAELATMICTHLITARKMMEYVVRRDDVVEKVLEIYQARIHKSVDEVLGKARVVLPRLVGHGAIEGVKGDVVRETMLELPAHSAEIEAYMDKAFALCDTLKYRLARLAPEKFEGMLHPVFEEDEWMVLLLGAVLGVLVGLLQAWALGA